MGARPLCAPPAASPPPRRLPPQLRVFCVGLGAERRGRTEVWGPHAGLGDAGRRVASTRVSRPPPSICCAWRRPAAPLVFFAGGDETPLRSSGPPLRIWGRVRGSSHSCPSVGVRAWGGGAWGCGAVAASPPPPPLPPALPHRAPLFPARFPRGRGTKRLCSPVGGEAGGGGGEEPRAAVGLRGWGGGMRLGGGAMRGESRVVAWGRITRGGFGAGGLGSPPPPPPPHKRGGRSEVTARRVGGVLLPHPPPRPHATPIAPPPASHRRLPCSPIPPPPLTVPTP